MPLKKGASESCISILLYLIGVPSVLQYTSVVEKKKSSKITKAKNEIDRHRALLRIKAKSSHFWNRCYHSYERIT
jgi:hypothetical protein